MAIKDGGLTVATGNVAGTYDQKSKDGNTQASNKFGGGNHPTTDAGAKKFNQKVNQPTDKKNQN